MNDAHLTAKLASSEELITTSQTVDRLFVFINVPKFVQDHVYSTVRFSYLDLSGPFGVFGTNICKPGTRILRQGRNREIILN